MDDQAIIALYLRRDEEAIRASEAAYGPLCRRVALNILGAPEDAEECVNDTWHTAWNRIPPVIPASLRCFLGRVTRDLALDRWRRDHAQKRYAGAETLLSELEDCLPGEDTAAAALEAAELERVLEAWLRGQTAEDRALFVRRYWHGDSVKALAKECGISQNRMAQRMLGLRRSLKRALEQEGFTV